jgi:hypothetical protein
MNTHESSKASIETYHKLVLSGQAQRNQDKVMAWILNHHEYIIITRNVISERTGMKIQAVCGAVGRLVDDEYVSQDKETIKDPVTTNPAHRIRPVFPQPVQREFTWPEK